MLEEKCKREDTVDSQPESEMISEEGINFYNYWKVLVKRKRVFLGIFLIPLVIVAAIVLLQPRCYRGESAIINPAIPPQTIVSLLGEFNDTKKDEVFINTPGAIKSVLLSIPKKPNDRVNIILESATADVIPQALQDLHHYICNLREFREEIARINEKIDLRIEKYTEAKKANLFFLNLITDLLKKRQISSTGINPADLIRKDADLSVEIMNLQSEKEIAATRGSLAPISITTQPSYLTITLNLFFTGIVSLVAGIFVIFFLEYIDRMKAREKK
jgi:Fe-S-cluster formation regulator IscX/YfhJ